MLSRGIPKGVSILSRRGAPILGTQAGSLASFGTSAPTRTSISKQNIETQRGKEATRAEEAKALSERKRNDFFNFFTTTLLPGYNTNIDNIMAESKEAANSQEELLKKIRFANLTLIKLTRNKIKDYKNFLTPDDMISIKEGLRDATRFELDQIEELLNYNSLPRTQPSAAPIPPPSSGTSSNYSKGPSVDPKSDPDWNFMGLLAAILLSAGYAAFHTISEEDAKKQNEAVKSELDLLIKEGPAGLIRLDGEIYDALYALKSSGFDTAVSESLKKKLILFRAGLAKIKIRDATKGPEEILHPELENVRVDTVGDALKLMEQYRIIIGSSQPAVWFEWATLHSLFARRRETNTSKMPNGKNLYELAARFQSINPFSSKGRYLGKHVSKVLNEMPLERELKGGSKRRTRRHRKSRKSRKNRK